MSTLQPSSMKSAPLIETLSSPVVESIGSSILGMPITGFRFLKPGARKIYVLGGVHGDEKEGTICAWALLQNLFQQAKNRTTNTYPEILIIPEFNVDGVQLNTRLNAQAVDLNRNLPTQDWNPQAFNERYPPGPSANSEPESQALVNLLETDPPHLILSLHSWHPLLNVNGDCMAEAKILQSHHQYKIVETIPDHPAPGCLGTYAGIERKIPTITYEIERGLSPQKVIAIHVPAILDLFSQFGSQQVS